MDKRHFANRYLGPVLVLQTSGGTSREELLRVTGLG